MIFEHSLTILANITLDRYFVAAYSLTAKLILDGIVKCYLCHVSLGLTLLTEDSIWVSHDHARVMLCSCIFRHLCVCINR